MDEIIHFRRIAITDPAYDPVLALRDEVLRKPLGQSIYNDDLTKDERDAIFIAEDAAGSLLACVMLHPLPDGRRKLRQMAVRPDLQGKGIGAQLVRFAEKAMTDEACPGIEMNARGYALPFYEKLGYTITGEEFMEVGIPHFRMEKVLL